MSTPIRTAEASRDAIRAYIREIQKTLDAAEPTLAEIEEIEYHSILLSQASRRWKSSEALIMAAEHRDHTQQLVWLGLAVAP